MNKKKIFLNIILSFFSALCVCSIILSQIFESASMEFSGAGIEIFIAIFMFFESKYAFKPLKKISRSNPVKGWFHLIGKPKSYRNLCIVLSVIFLFLGVENFLRGLLKII